MTEEKNLPNYTVHKHTEDGKLEKIGAAWKKVDKNGREFLSVTVKLANGEFHLMLFPYTEFKKPDNVPGMQNKGGQAQTFRAKRNGEAYP